MKRITACIVIVSLLTSLVGCAGYRPIVDMKDVDRNRYEVDLRECQEYAEQVSPATSSVVGAVIVAAFGAAIGAIIGSFIGKAGEGAAMGAALGGVEGAAVGAAQGAKGQRDVIVNCMNGRGYKVLR